MFVKLIRENKFKGVGLQFNGLINLYDDIEFVKKLEEKDVIEEVEKV